MGSSPGPIHTKRLLPLFQVCSLRSARHGDGGTQSDHSDPSVPQWLVLTMDWLFFRDGECLGDYISLGRVPINVIISSVTPSFLDHLLLNLDTGLLLLGSTVSPGLPAPLCGELPLPMSRDLLGCEP